MAETRLAIADTREAGGVTFELREVVLSALQTSILFNIRAASSSAYEMTGIVAQLPDGAFRQPVRIEQGSSDLVAIFEPFPRGEKITISLSPILTQVAEPVRREVRSRSPAHWPQGQHA
jgi:hypothetical protein